MLHMKFSVHDLYAIKYSIKYKVDYKLIKAIMHTESKTKHNSISKKGSIGMMQLQPKTAKELKVDPYNLEDNIKGGTEYLSKQLIKFNNIEHAVAAYNAGTNAVVKHKGVPPYKETRNYVQAVCKQYDCNRKYYG